MRYEEVLKSFSWDDVKKYFGQDFRDKLIREGGEVGVLRVDDKWNKQSLSYSQLKDKAQKLSSFLRNEFKVSKGDVMACLAEKKIEQVVYLVSSWMLGAIFEPLFTAFGPSAIEMRIKDKKPKVILVQEDQYDKIKDLFDNIITFPGRKEKSVSFDEAISYDKLKREEWEKISYNDPSGLQYTSGTTGRPKGALQNFRTLYSLYVYMKYGIGIRDDDVFWTPASPGWAYGLGVGIISPIIFGKPVIFFDKLFSPEDTLKFAEDFKITNFAFVPTAYRMIMGKVREPKKYNLRITRASSAGEPLNPEVIRWFKENFGFTIKDHYGQTETGMIVYNGWGYEADIKPGSMGLPAPGYEVTVIDGVIAVNKNTEGFYFLGYINDEERTKRAYRGDWYLTGDMAEVDKDGYFWFVGREDEVIKVSGYRVSPFEIESVLIQHPAVMEAAVLGVDDPVKGKVIKAFIVLKPSYNPSEDLANDIINFVREKYSKHAYPREVKFVNSLPKTESGKIQKYKLREML
ncbi:AMP-dependent synthetase [Sulfolobus sp. A20]|uniref:acyl-CoA synthetase n=1 Tax=Sulfolobaceae TaxID=118883 RepID=UPI0008460D24|nr:MULTISPECIES: AMP-binding protein [unclassified Sulfolobus]TRM85464.1 AMP-dependent synthetase [Sulfolobus sp. F3]TRM86463.1 AMP-dependent synthetase [Sulfolobus sp. E3]TRM89518.1 AMP-dependent synthetase [Sulfolobus sp. C3]TRM99166.1 AMP-dependent synthetase [Sulfolobus sp. F1]TRM99712.1 AMP-dependent synthetase [Sulfolobus sp. E1]